MVLGSRSLGLCVLLLGATAFAQRVVILEIDHDTGGQLRAQIERAVELGGVVTLVKLVPLQRFRSAASKVKLKGPAVNTGAAVARVSRVLRLDAAVGGEVVGGIYHVLIYDRSGQELWSKDLALTRGLLTDELLSRLGRAIAAAGEQGAAQPVSSADPELVDEPETQSTPAVEAPPPVAEEPVTEAPASAVLETAVPAPPFIRGWVAGTTTWRSQCLRPGVNRCRDYDTATNHQLIIDFSPSVPYLGVVANLEVFPLAGLTQAPAHRFLNGLGLSGSFRYGHTVTRVVEETAQGNGPVKDVDSNEMGWSAELVYRVHFQMGFGAPQPVGYVGLRGGLQAATFNIDPNAATTLPSSVRRATLTVGFPVVGLDVSIPIAGFLGIDLSGSFFINPRPAADVVISFGNPDDPTGGVTSTGFAAEGGFSGQLVGPLGWVLHGRYTSFVDHFHGQGQKWTCTGTCTGVGEETSIQVLWGLRGQY